MGTLPDNLGEVTPEPDPVAEGEHRLRAALDLLRHAQQTPTAHARTVLIESAALLARQAADWLEQSE